MMFTLKSLTAVVDRFASDVTAAETLRWLFRVPGVRANCAGAIILVSVWIGPEGGERLAE